MRYLIPLILLAGCLNETEIQQVAKIVSETPVTVRVEQVPVPDDHDYTIQGRQVKTWTERRDGTWYMRHEHLSEESMSDSEWLNWVSYRDSDDYVNSNPITRAEQIEALISILSYKYPAIPADLFLSYYGSFEYLEVMSMYWLVEYPKANDNGPGPYYEGDLNKDIRTDMEDFAILSENWLKIERPW
jgi:hypothetical protein